MAATSSILRGVLRDVLLGSTSLTPPPVDVEITRLVTNSLAPGNDGGGLSAGTEGTVRSSNLPYVNQSEAELTELALVFSGWAHMLNAVDAITPMDYSPTWSVEYPVDTTVQTGVTPVVTPGSNVVTEFLTLSTPIPAGATFKVAVSVTEAAGQKLPMSRDGVNNRFVPQGIVTRKLKSQLNPICLGIMGDSIFTNSGLPPTTAAVATGLPSVHMSIIGSTGASQLGRQANRIDLFQKLGVTHLVTNYGANDINSVGDISTLLSNFEQLRAQWAASGFEVMWATTTPRIQASAVTRALTNMTNVGGVASATVSSVDALAPDMMLTIASATDAAYNGLVKLLSVNTGDNTITFSVPPTAPAGSHTGTLQIVPRLFRAVQTPGLNTANWSTMNGWARANTNCIEVADAFTPARDVCQAITGYDDPQLRLRAPRPMMTVTGIINSTTFRIPTDDPEGFPGNWCTGSSLQWLSGANAGLRATISGTPVANSIQVPTPANTIQIGDTFCVRHDFQSRSIGSDGLHPDLLGNWGGVKILEDVLKAKFTALRAAA